MMPRNLCFLPFTTLSLTGPVESVSNGSYSVLLYEYADSVTQFISFEIELKEL